MKNEQRERPVPWPTDEEFVAVIAETQRQGDRQILLALRLHDLKPKNPDGAYPGYKRLAALTGLTPGYVRKRLSAMVQGGRLYSEQRGRRAGYYIVTCSPQREHVNKVDLVSTCSLQGEHVPSTENTSKQVDVFPTCSLQRTTTCSPQSATEKKKRGKPTWLTPFLEAWTDRFGGKLGAGRLAGAFGELREEHNTDEILLRWKAYLAQADPNYANPERFASTFGDWGARQTDTLRNLQELTA